MIFGRMPYKIVEQRLPVGAQHEPVRGVRHAALSHLEPALVRARILLRREAPLESEEAVLGGGEAAAPETVTPPRRRR